MGHLSKGGGTVQPSKRVIATWQVEIARENTFRLLGIALSAHRCPNM